MKNNMDGMKSPQNRGQKQKPREWPIAEVSRETGLTSRALRHYEQIGLLVPSRVAHNGYRFYGEAELARLYRIMSLRSLDLPLAEIQRALVSDASLTEAIAAHLAVLEERRARTQHQISVVSETLLALQSEQHMSIADIFAAFDHGQYEAEARERWGESAVQPSVTRREAMTREECADDDRRSLTVNSALRQAAEAKLSPSSEAFQTLIHDHYQWITAQWNGRAPEREAYAGLGQLYVADARFAATYGGQANAEVILEAMQRWIETNLP